MSKDEKNTPAPPPQAAQQTSLKSIHISGTAFSWQLGQQHTYTVQEGDDIVEKVGTIIGMGVIMPPAIINGQPNPEAGWAQVHIVYEDNYRDVFTCADHLIVKNMHVHAIAVVKTPQLVVPGR